MRDRLARFGLLVVALAAAAVTVHRVATLFLSYPLPWPDEALFADVATHLIRHGSMGTDLYRECLPGSSAHYYLTPPLYPVMMALAFVVGGARLETMRVVSLITAGGVLITLFAVGRRTGMGRLALLPPCLLALDIVFLRGSLVGRMDMLTLGLVLLTLWLVLPAGVVEAHPPRAAVRMRSFWVGLVAGLALETHPLGAAAAVLAIAAWAIPALERRIRGPDGEKPRFTRFHLGWIGLGLALAILPWALYVLRDFAGFVEQYGQQLTRKSSEWGFPALGIAQWRVGTAPVVTVWIAGLVGLVWAALRERRFILPALGQLVLFATVIPNCEMWYGVYLMPLTYLGIVRGMQSPGMRGPLRWAVSGAFAVVATAFVILQATQLSAREPLYASAGRAYPAWCRSVARMTPSGATVLMEAIPTPYFGIASRTDLNLRLFPPRGFRIDDARIARLLDRVDIVIAGSSLANQPVRDVVDRRGAQVAGVGPEQGFPFPVRLIRLRRPMPADTLVPEATGR